MAEEKIRYRVELDPRQIEGQLSSLRASIGGMLSSVSSGASYGGQLASGAYNSISSDISRAQSAFANRPTFNQVGRSLTEGAIEFGTTGAAVGTMLTAGSVAAFGGANTLSGILGGTAMGARTAVAAGGMGLRAGFAAARTGVGVARVMAGAALSPVALTLGLGMAAGSAVTSIGERVLSDFRGGNNIEDILRSRGVSAGRASSIAPEMIARGHSELGMGAAQTAGILEQGMSLGLFSAAGNDPDKIGKKLIQTAKRAKEMMKVLNSSLGEAMQYMGEMDRMGIGGDVVGIQSNIMASGAATGLGSGAMTRAASLGAQMARQVGMATGTGAGLGIDAVARAQAGASGLTSGQLTGAGGISGLATSMMQAQAAFMAGPTARGVAFGVSDMGAFARGEVGVAQATVQAAERFAAGGPSGMAKSVYDMDRRIGSISAADTKLMQIGIIKNVSDVFGIDPNNIHRLAMQSGAALGFDVNTSQGRTQALAMVRGAMDPGVGNRHISELQARQRQIAEASMGFFPTVGAMGTQAYEATLGAVADGVSRDIAETSEDLSRLYSRSTTDFGRSLRSRVRALTGDTFVRSADSEQYAITIPRALTTQPENAQAMLQTLARMGGRKPADILSGINGRYSGSFTTSEERDDRAQLMGMFSDSEATVKSSAADVFRTYSFINKDSKLMASLSGADPEKAVGLVISSMGAEAPSTAIIAAALNRSNVELGSFSDSAEAVAIGEAEGRTATDRISALMAGTGTPGGFMNRFAVNLGRSLTGSAGGEAEKRIESVRGTTASIIGAAGTSDESRKNAALLSFRYLTSKDGDFFAVQKQMRATFGESSAEMIASLDKVRANNSSRAIMAGQLKNIVEPILSSSAGAIMVSEGKAVNMEQVKRSMAALDRVTISSGPQGSDIDKLSQGSPDQRAAADTFLKIGGAIEDQRRINAALFHAFIRRLPSSDPASMRNSQGR